jgi:S-adenosylmethionine synthetase
MATQENGKLCEMCHRKTHNYCPSCGEWIKINGIRNNLEVVNQVCVGCVERSYLAMSDQNKIQVEEMIRRINQRNTRRFAKFKRKKNRRRLPRDPVNPNNLGRVDF